MVQFRARLTKFSKFLKALPDVVFGFELYGHLWSAKSTSTCSLAVFTFLSFLIIGRAWITHAQKQNHQRKSYSFRALVRQIEMIWITPFIRFNNGKKHTLQKIILFGIGNRHSPTKCRTTEKYISSKLYPCRFIQMRILFDFSTIHFVDMFPLQTHCI